MLRKDQEPYENLNLAHSRVPFAKVRQPDKNVRQAL
jgi:hypothetical protein